MRDILITLIVTVGLPFMIRRPSIGVLFWIVFSMLNPHRLTWGFAYSIPFAQIITIATLIGVLFTKEPRRFKGGAAAGVLFALVLWMMFTTIYALVPDRAAPMLERVVKIQFVTFLALLVLYRREHVHAAVWAIVLSVGFFAVKGGVFTLATLGQHRVYGPPESFLAENNALALATVMTIPLWAYLFVEHRQRWLRAAIAGCIALSAVSVFGSYSRGALLAIAAMTLFLWLKGRHKLLLGAAFATGAVGLLAFMPEQWEARMDTIRDYQGEQSAMSRIETWKMLFNLAMDRPLLGGGFEPYQKWIFQLYNPAYDNTHSAHSIYFQVLGEHGFVGLALFLAFWALVWRTCSTITRATRNRPEEQWAFWLTQMTKVSLIGYFVGGAFLNLANWDMPYYLFVAIAVTHFVIRQRRQEAAVVATEATGPPIGAVAGNVVRITGPNEKAR